MLDMQQLAAAAPQLDTLRLFHFHIANWGSIIQLTALKTLSFRSVQAAAHNPAAGTTQLAAPAQQASNQADTTLPLDLSALAGLVQLTSLTLQQVTIVSEDAISVLTNLTSLSLSADGPDHWTLVCSGSDAYGKLFQGLPQLLPLRQLQSADIHCRQQIAAAWGVLAQLPSLAEVKLSGSIAAMGQQPLAAVTKMALMCPPSGEGLEPLLLRASKVQQLQLDLTDVASEQTSRTLSQLVAGHPSITSLELLGGDVGYDLLMKHACSSEDMEVRACMPEQGPCIYTPGVHAMLCSADT